MAEVIRYIDTASSGGDGTTQGHSGSTAAYASMSAWEAAEQTDLVTDTDYHRVLCAGGIDGTDMTIVGWTTGASNYISIEGDPTAPDGDGKNDTYKSSTSYYMKEFTATTGQGIAVNEDFVHFDGIQLRNSQTSGSYDPIIAFGTAGTGATSVMKNCKIDCPNATIGTLRGIYIWDSDRDLTLIANLLDWKHGTTTDNDMAISLTTGCDINLYNNTFVRADGAASGWARCVVGDGSNTVTAQNNCYATFGDDVSAATITASYNAGKQDDDSTGHQDIQNSDRVNEWTDFTTGDWSIKDTSSVLYDNGTTGGDIPTVDQNGTTYTTADIGCFAFPVDGSVGSGLLSGQKLQRVRLMQ